MLLLVLFASAAGVLAQSPPADATIMGETADDDFGWEVAPAGDVNGDGIPDLIVGAPSNDAVAGFAGRAYLFLGPVAGNLDAADAEAIISAEAFGDNLGFSVASAGDVNGDGTGDIIVGARSNDTRGIQSGRAYLFLGPVSGSLDATDADAIISGDDFDEVGRSVAPAGDLDGDGFDDIIIGTDIAGPQFEGQAFIFHGPLTGERNADTADAIVSGSFANESLGAQVASAGDQNGDGVPDLMFGAPRFPLNGQGTGRAYIFYAPISGEINAANADAILFGEELNDSFGTSVAPAGDVNGDGNDDVIVGADQLFRTGAGKAYVFYGPLSGSVLAANAGAILTGENLDDLFGTSVSGVGDFNGDGLGDVVVGAWDNGGGGGRSGRAYVFHGPLNGTIPAGNADLIITGAPSDEVGLSVSGGDVNGDGAADVIVGAPQFADGDPGYAVVYFGEGGGAPDLSITTAPRNPPIILPPQGGNFRYDVTVVNESDLVQTVDIWTVLAGPGVNRTLGPFTRTIQPGASFTRTFRQRIPGNVPAGTYTVTGNAGTFPDAEVSDSFTFEKLAAASGGGGQ
jgi:hypothetical protein